ncbi:type 4b pilus protein PilO2 [Francisella sp. TX07-6608]|uniref:type 4b pilus protein PilO2 n=1 Tax=Francisella sp. TX07-6608 TaxID=573568 RepID=UPI0008F99935|nr:type 4b pilus protein PilO2 [Francisella sp. TX07-6608]
MTKAQLVKLQGKLFAINLTWFELNSKKQLQHTTKLLKANYGVLSSSTIIDQDKLKQKKILVGLATKQLSACYSLASVIANKLKDGIFITDKISIANQQDQLYWLCIFKDKQPLAKVVLKDNTKTISVDGDQFLNLAQVKHLLDVYTKQYHTSIFIDLNNQHNLNIDSATDIVLDEILQSKLSSKYLIQKINRDYRIFILLSIIVIIGTTAIFFYKQHQQAIHKQLLAKQQQLIAFQKKAQPTTQEQIYKDIQINHLGMVLNSFNQFLTQLPVVIAGWNIHSVSYNSAEPDLLELIYQANFGMNILTAKNEATKLIALYPHQQASIEFSNNNQTMLIRLAFAKQDSQIDKLELNDLNQAISTEQGIATIADVQANFLEYNLGKIIAIDEKYSKQEISFNNINSLIFENLKALAQRHSNLIANVITITFDNNFNLGWSIKGNIYA